MKEASLVDSEVPPFAARMVVTQAPCCWKGGTQQVNTQKVVGKVGKFNLCFRDEQLTSQAGTVLLHDCAQRLGVARLLDEELKVKVRERGYRQGQGSRGLLDNLILGGEHLSDLEVLRGTRGRRRCWTLRRSWPRRLLASFCASLPWATCGTCRGSTCGCNRGCAPTSRPRAARLTSIRASMNKPRRTRKGRRTLTMGRLALIPCSPFGPRQGSCSLATCVGGVLTPPAMP